MFKSLYNKVSSFFKVNLVKPNKSIVVDSNSTSNEVYSIEKVKITSPAEEHLNDVIKSIGDLGRNPNLKQPWKELFVENLYEGAYRELREASSAKNADEEIYGNWFEISGKSCNVSDESVLGDFIILDNVAPAA